ncbi:hypothetical protein H1D32_13380 [Anaerobacillus sp. CMMVII]|uniref:bacteriophage Gp15 family protein n=1 Tax=Anaerobacillus sp. CMMVII TaxID=2755588 RepID=UPI0021B7B7E8|nr:bacteriophage Gp15 family protein [Anaerobacillus sp. CMMVII]MCT8138646.1 hypothetical protein [Anaerobacillus sp. CMMVII]
MITVFKLTDHFNGDVLTYNGIELKLNLYFDVVLRSYELMKDDFFNEYDKADIYLRMFVLNYEDIKGINIFEKNKLITIIFDQFINPKETNKEIKSDEKLYDFQIDAELIYASFFMDYGMDLIDQQGQLHWYKFLALFNGLTDKTPFKQVLSIRTTEIPAPTKHNQKERDRIIKLKQLYRIAKDETVEGLDAKLDSFAATLRPFGGDVNV